MKSLILILSLTILGACSAYKGTHTAAKSMASRDVASQYEQDPAVEDIRQLFRDGKIEDSEDIPRYKDISCKVYEYEARKNRWVVTRDAPALFHFVRRTWGDKHPVYNKGDNWRLPLDARYDFTEMGMQNRFRGSVSTIRLTENKDSLIVEYAVKIKSTIPLAILGTPLYKDTEYGTSFLSSDAAQSHHVTNYMYCPLDSN